jgi:hypothetical protein
MVGAYLEWTHEDEPDLSDSVVILDGKPETIEEIDYESKDVRVSVTQREDAWGTYSWVDVEPQGDVPEPEPTPDNPHAPPPEDRSPAQFKGGKMMEQVLEGLAPFTAKRVLEGVDDYKLDELGLGEAEATLTIKRAGKQPKTYELGGGVYGGANAYVRDPESGTIYIVDAKAIRPLQSAKRTLPDRRLIGAELKEIRAVKVTSGEATAAFEQHNPDDAKAQFWSVMGEEEAAPAGAAWLDKVLRLRSAEYVPEGSEPSGMSEAFSYQVSTGERTTTVTVFRAPGEEGADDWYARSEHTRALVKLHNALAAEVFADLQSALDAGQSA